MVNTVMASAERPMAARSGERVKKRMAETSVPEWLTPMKKTNVVMSAPHITGSFSPVMPRPSRRATDQAQPPKPTRDRAVPSASQ